MSKGCLTFGDAGAAPSVTSNSFWRVMVEFPLDENREDVERALNHAAGREFGFAGAGVEMRDVGWHCDLEIDACRIERALKAIGFRPSVTQIFPATPSTTDGAMVDQAKVRHPND